MAAKTVKVSDDDVTYHTLPGSTGDANNQAASIDDTIFGQTYKSSQTGLIGWDVGGQAFYKGFAGYVAKILKQGVSTAMTNEAMTNVSGELYRVTNTAKRIINPAVTLLVEQLIQPELVTNGAFAADTDWSKGTGATIAAGLLSFDGSQDASNGATTQTIAISAGVAYTVVFTVSGCTAGSVAIKLGTGTGTSRSTNATFTEDITAATNTTLTIQPDADFDGNIDNISVKIAASEAAAQVDVTEHVVSYNYLFGELTMTDDTGDFDPADGPLQVTGEYYPTAALGKANSYTLTQTTNPVEDTDFATAQANNGHRTFEPGLRTVQIDLEGFYDVASGMRALLTGRTNIIVEINPDGSGKSLARGFFQVNSQGQSGNVGALEEEKISLMLQVPSDEYAPFGWYHASDTTLHTSMQKVLDAWLNEEPIYVKYLYDGTNGFKGSSIVTEVSMKGALDSMNEFTCKFQGTGQITVVGTG